MYRGVKSSSRTGESRQSDQDQGGVDVAGQLTYRQGSIERSEGWQVSLVLAIMSIRDRTLTPSEWQKLSRKAGLAMGAGHGHTRGSQRHDGWLRWRQRLERGPKPYCESAFDMDMCTTLVDLGVRQMPVSPVRQSVPEKHRAQPREELTWLATFSTFYPRHSCRRSAESVT